MEPYLIGIDAGGTRTTASAFSLTGEYWATETGGFGNVTVDFAQGMAHICDTVERLIARLGSVPAFVCLGCAGIETGERKALAHDQLAVRFQTEVFVTNDAMLALYAALEGRDGILVIAGTGSIGYLKQNHSLHRFGGWGHLINDDGSGYSVAIRAIRFIAYSFDAGDGNTPLTQAVFSHLGISELRQLIDFTYRSDKGQIAALVPVIDQLAGEGDPQACEIMEWAGERLAWLAVGLAGKYGVHSPEIAISGSVVRKSRFVKASFCRVLNQECPGWRLVDGDFSPEKGGYYLWLEQHLQE